MQQNNLKAWQCYNTDLYCTGATPDYCHVKGIALDDTNGWLYYNYGRQLRTAGNLHREIRRIGTRGTNEGVDQVVYAKVSCERSSGKRQTHG